MCELSQPIGKTEFSSIAKNRTNCVSWVRKELLHFSDCYMLHLKEGHMSVPELDIGSNTI